MRRALRTLLAGLSLVAWALGCAAVDRDAYLAGDEGTARFENPGNATVYLAGCSEFAFEKLEDDGWSLRHPAVVCIWEGFARPVASGESVVTPFRAPDEAGTWRLVYAVGLACADDRPLSREHCDRIVAVRTAPFEVTGLCEPLACGPPLGMPNWLCPDGSVGGPTDRCLEDPETGACGWEIRSCPE